MESAILQQQHETLEAFVQGWATEQLDAALLNSDSAAVKNKAALVGENVAADTAATIVADPKHSIVDDDHDAFEPESTPSFTSKLSGIPTLARHALADAADGARQAISETVGETAQALVESVGSAHTAILETVDEVQRAVLEAVDEVQRAVIETSTCAQRAVVMSAVGARDAVVMSAIGARDAVVMSAVGTRDAIVDTVTSTRRSAAARYALIQMLFGGRTFPETMARMGRSSVLMAFIIGCTLGLNMVQISVAIVGALFKRRLDSRRWTVMANSKISGHVLRLIQWIITRRQNARVTFSGDVTTSLTVDDEPPLTGIPSGENALIVSNHVAWSDFYLVHALAERMKMLSFTKYYVKDTLKYVPSFGWAMYFVGMVFLKRRSSEDRDRMTRAMEFIKQAQLPVWLVNYPEGHRFSRKHLGESQSFAMDRELKPLKHVLQPRTKGFVQTVQALRGSHVQAVYDLTLCYEHRALAADGGVPTADAAAHAPSMWRLFAGDVARDYRLHVHVKRYAMDALPVDDEVALAAWLRERFVEKDAYLEAWRSGRVLTEAAGDAMEEADEDVFADASEQ